MTPDEQDAAVGWLARHGIPDRTARDLLAMRCSVGGHRQRVPIPAGWVVIRRGRAGAWVSSRVRFGERVLPWLAPCTC